jgi:NTP pyrophosphatase (non-canonical NTP hydrolase)
MSGLNRPEITIEQFIEASDLVKERLLHYAKHKGPQAIISAHEISGLIKEETDEFYEEVQKNNEQGIKDELVDVALTAIWGLASMEVTDVMNSWGGNEL